MNYFAMLHGLRDFLADADAPELLILSELLRNVSHAADCRRRALTDNQRNAATNRSLVLTYLARADALGKVDTEQADEVTP